MVKKVTFFTPELTTPRWMGDPGERRTLLPGGGLVNDLQWTADIYNRKPIVSGTLLARRAGAYLWEKPVNALTTNLSVPFKANAAIAATVLSLRHVSGFAVGDAITIAQGATTETKTITAINRELGTITVNTGLTNAFTSAGGTATVRLTTAVAQTEFYLLAYDIVDAVINAETPALYRPGALVRENFLPAWPFTGESAILAKIRSLYECVTAI
jgi:hypothetical protein